MSLIYKIVEEERYEDFLKIRRDWLADPKEYDYVKNHIDRYGKLPSLHTFKAKTKYQGEAPEPFSYYWEEYENNGLVKEFVDSGISQKVNKLLSDGMAKEAIDTLLDFLQKLNSKREDEKIIKTMEDVGQLLLSRLDAVEAMKQGIWGIPTGWPTLDEATNGSQPGDLNLVVGRVKTGKTMALLHMMKAAQQAGFSTMLISMEMSLLSVAKRLFSLYGGIQCDVLRSEKISNFLFQKVKNIVSELKTAKAYFVEGRFTLTLSKVSTLVASVNPDILFIDGGYLLKLGSVSNKRAWEAAKEIADDLKRLALTRNIPIISTFQLTRETTKRSAESVGLEHIHLTDALSANCSWAVGLFDVDGDEKIKEVRVLGSREGEPVNFIINYDWEKMDFNEIRPKGGDDNDE